MRSFTTRLQRMWEGEGGGGGGAGGGAGGDGGKGGDGGGAGGDGGKGDNKPKVITMTQEDLDALIQGRVARVEAKYKDHDAIKTELDKLKAAGMTEAEKIKAEATAAAERAAAAEAKLAAIETTRLREAVLTKAGLPASFAGRILGTTEDEIKADVTALKKDLQAMGAGSTGVGGGGGGGGANPGGPQNDSKVDYRTAKPEDFEAELRKYGLRPM